MHPRLRRAMSRSSQRWKPPIHSSMAPLIVFSKKDSYMRIVQKTTRDMVLKAITLFIIKKLQSYINDTLMLELMDHSDDEYVSITVMLTVFIYSYALHKFIDRFILYFPGESVRVEPRKGRKSIKKTRTSMRHAKRHLKSFVSTTFSWLIRIWLEMQAFRYDLTPDLIVYRCCVKRNGPLCRRQWKLKHQELVSSRTYAPCTD